MKEMKAVVSICCVISAFFLTACQKPVHNGRGSGIKVSVSVGDTLEVAKSKLYHVGAEQVQMEMIYGTGKEPRVSSYELRTGEILVLSSGANWRIIHQISLCENPDQPKAEREYVSLKRIVISNGSILSKEIEN